MGSLETLWKKHSLFLSRDSNVMDYGEMVDTATGLDWVRAEQWNLSYEAVVWLWGVEVGKARGDRCGLQGFAGEQSRSPRQSWGNRWVWLQSGVLQ